jgi:hypothetical protein
VPRHPASFQLRTGTDDISTVRASVNTENGRFQLGTPIVPGAYVLRVTQDQTIGETPFVICAADVGEVALALSPLIDIPVVTRFTGTPPEFSQFGIDGRPQCFARLQHVGALASAVASSAADKGIHGLAPGSYRASITCPGGYARSAVSGTHDLAADPILTLEPGTSPPPIEILAVYGGGSIRGKVVSDRDDPLGPTVIVVPRFASVTGPQMVRSFHAPGETSYQFFFGNLAPGSYTVYGFARNDIEFRDPEFQRALSGGVSVEIDGDAPKEVTIDGVIP